MPPRRTSSTRPGSSACAGSASSRVPAGSSRRPSTRASPTAWGSCTRRGSGGASSTPPWWRRWPPRTPGCGRRPRVSSSRRCGSPASSTTWATARSPTSSTSTSWRRSRRPPTGGDRGAKALTHEDLSQLIIERELGPAHPAPAPGPGRRDRGPRRVRRRRVDRPGLGRLPGLEAAARRPGDAALGPLAPAAPVRRLHGRQPGLRPARRLLHRRVRRPGGCRAAPALRLHLGTRPHPLRARPRRPGDVPDRPALHVPAGLLPPDGARHRPRPRRGLRAVHPGDLRRGFAGRRPGPATRTSTSTRSSTRRPAGDAARTSS